MKKNLLRYPGSKTILAPWIISHFPDRHDTYNEPFGGSGVVLVNKERSGIETYNDLNEELINVFRVLRDHTEEFVHKIKWSAWSDLELQLATEPADDPIERARRFFVRLWFSMYPFDEKLSFRRQKVFTRDENGRAAMRVGSKSWMNLDHIWEWAERFRGVQIECMDAVEFIQLYDNDRALFYVDPPYVKETRIRKSHYEFEYTEADHVKLAEALNAAEGMVVLSGYHSDLYDRLYTARGWSRKTKEAMIDGGTGKRIESLYLNPAVQHWLEAERAQLKFNF